MTRYFFGGAAAVLCAGSLVAAQAPAGQQSPAQPQRGAQPQPQTQQSEPQTRTPTQASAGASTTVTGCVYREADVPGRTPNVAERAGVLEDYILADVRMSPAGAGGATGTSGAGGAAAPGAGAGAAGAVGSSGSAGAAAATGSASAGSASMYKLELIDDNRLQALVGKRVEVTGRIDRESGDAGARPQGTTGVGGGAAAGGAGTTSTGAPGAVSGNPGSAGNPGADATGNTRAGAGGAQAGAAGSAGVQTGAQADRSIGPDRIELPEFEVTSIREMAGTCPATPAGR